MEEQNKLHDKQHTSYLILILLGLLLAALVVVLTRIPSKGVTINNQIATDHRLTEDGNSPFLGKNEGKRGDGGLVFHAPDVLCTNASCLMAGYFPKLFLNKNFAPCDNFYEHVCSKWRRSSKSTMTTTRFKSDRSMDGLMVHKTIQRGILKILQDRIHYPELITARMFYSECMNKKTLERRRWGAFIDLLRMTSLTGWPFHRTSSIVSTTVWVVAAKAFRWTGLSAFYRAGLDEHIYKGKERIISIGAPDILISPSEAATNWTVIWYYYAVIAAVSPFKEAITASKIAMEVATFEQELARIFPYLNDIVKGPSQYKIENMNSRPALRQFISALFGNVTSMPSNMEILLRYPEYITSLTELVSRTPKYVVLNYIGFRMMLQVSAFLPDEVKPLRLILTQRLLKKKHAQLHRSDICATLLANTLPTMTLYVGYHAFRDVATAIQISKMTGMLKEAFVEFVSRLAWMDAWTRSKVKKKITKTSVKLFFPEWISNKYKVFALHENVPMVIKSEGLKSFWTIKGKLTLNSLSRDQPPEEERWLGTIFDSDCSYDTRRKIIYYPLTFLNVSIPADNNMLLMHIPGTGAKMLQCLMTLFLEEGYHNQNANTSLKLIWSVNTRNNFKEIKKCFASERKSLSTHVILSEKQIDHHLLQDMSDSGVIKPLYKVFKDFIDVRYISEESFEKLYGLTVDQLFFVLYAWSKSGSLEQQ